MQDALLALRSESHGPAVGYKVGMTTAVMQNLVGLGEPAAGKLLAATIHAGPATIRCDDFVHLGVECEIAVRLAADLPAAQAPFSRAVVSAAVGTVMPAFELIEDRNADYARFAAEILAVIGDNVWNGGIVLGEPVADWRRLDLAATQGRLTMNGKVVAQGQGRDVMGHPLEALAWLATMLARRGEQLAQGMVVMTGSIIATRFVAPGDTLAWSVEGLGEVSLTVG